MTAPVSADVIDERFRELLEALGDRESKKYGWRARAAEALGVSQAVVSNVLAGRRRVGWGVAARAAQRIGLDLRFYTDPSPNHRWWLEVQEDAADEVRPHYDIATIETLRGRALQLADLFEERSDAAMLMAHRLALEVEHSAPVLRARALRAAPSGSAEERAAALALIAALLTPGLRADDDERLMTLTIALTEQQRGQTSRLPPPPGDRTLFDMYSMTYFRDAEGALERLHDHGVRRGQGPLAPIWVEKLLSTLRNGRKLVDPPPAPPMTEEELRDEDAVVGEMVRREAEAKEELMQTIRGAKRRRKRPAKS